MTDLVAQAWVRDAADLIVRRLLDAWWQGAVAAAGIQAVGYLRPRQAPQTRYLIACAGLFVVCAAACLPSSGTARPGWLPADAALGLAGLWAAAVVLLSVRAVGGWCVLRRLRDEQPALAWAQPIAGLCGRLRLPAIVSAVVSVRLTAPGLLGWRRPVIVLPSALLAAADDRDVEAVLAHELAHVRRGDCVVNLLQMAIEILFAGNPFVWWMSHRARVEREHCCDDVAAAVCGDALGYAEALVRLERNRTMPLAGWPGTAGAIGAPVTARLKQPRSEFVARVRRLAEDPPDVGDDAMPWRWAVAFGGVAILVLWMMPTAVPMLVAGGSTLGAGWPSISSALAMSAGLGLLLGIRHACEPDHLLAVSALMTAERNAARAVGLGLSWGLGHAGSLLLVGAALAASRRRLPTAAAEVFELAVALMLVALGGRAMVMAWRTGAEGASRRHAHGAFVHEHRGAADHLHVGRWTLARRPLLVGMAHGLAGSGALAALVMANLPTISAQVGYLVVFGLGSILGMAALSACASWPMVRFVRRPATLTLVAWASGALSIVYGVVAGSLIVLQWFP